MSVVWVGDLGLNGNGKRGGNGSGLRVAPGNGGGVKQPVSFQTSSSANIAPAIGDGLSGKVAEGGQSVAGAGLTRAVEHFERNGVKGEELTGNGPQNPVGVAVGGNGRGVSAGIFCESLDGSAEQSGRQRKSQERRTIGGEVDGVVPVGRRTHHDVDGIGVAVWDENDLLKGIAISRGVHTQVVTIENEGDSVLAGDNEFMGPGTVLIGENHWPRGTQVHIVGVEDGVHVPRGEIIGRIDREIGSKLQGGHAVRLAARGDIEAVASGFCGGGEDVRGCNIGVIGGETVAALPDGS